MSLTDFFATQTPNVSQEMRAIFADRRTAAQPLSKYLVQSIDVIEDFSLRGGKMVRSSLVLLAYQLAGKELTRPIYQVAAGVELFHKHILNLDDMADRDDVRNGGPTIWKKYEEIFKGWDDLEHNARSFSEIDGTLMGSFAFELVRRADISAEQKLAVMDILNNKMYFETVAGWEIHINQNHESLADANEAEFMKGLDLVTSRYTFVGPLQIGLILAGQENSELSNVLEQYGLDVGLAFQITDDILGVFGDPAETGKAVGNDIREGKKTLLLQRAYRSAKPEDQAFLADVCGRELQADELERVQQIIKDTGSLEYSLQLAQEKITHACDTLQSLSISDKTAKEAQTTLIELAQFVGQRKK